MSLRRLFGHRHNPRVGDRTARVADDFRSLAWNPAATDADRSAAGGHVRAERLGAPSHHRTPAALVSAKRPDRAASSERARPRNEVPP